MIKVSFEPEQLDDARRAEWERLLARAHAATDRLAQRVRRGEAPTFDTDLCGDIKRWLMDHVFHNKCAYCEARIKPGAHGEAEHWRPKGAVTVVEDGERRRIEREGTPHPGYWWLAHAWHNLVPSCSECNGGSAKHTHFPVAGEHVFHPSEVDHIDHLDDVEQPLLLHPLRGPDPSEHLAFDDQGKASARRDSEHGRASIDVFALNRPVLQGDREDYLWKAAQGVKAAWEAVGAGTGTWEELGHRWHGPEQLYSLAVRQFFTRRLRERLALLPQEDDEPD